MLARLRALVGGRKPTNDEHEVQAALAAATIANRGEDEEGAPRILIVLAGGGGFRYAREDASAWLQSAYGLNDAQIGRALKMLHARVIESQRRANDGGDRGERWADWKPIRSV